MTEDDRGPALRGLTRRWNTDWTRHTVPYDELLSGGPPRDGIPSIDNPKFESIGNAAAWLVGNEPVIVVKLNGAARAYPLSIATQHEIINDTFNGEPILVTFCPLCNSAVVFERKVQGEAVEFGVSGLLRNSDLIMYDRKTESLFQQFTGEGIVGELAGTQLTFIPSQIISFADFRAAFPDGEVLSQDTGFARRYGTNPYAGYDQGNHPLSAGRLPLFNGDLDPRLPALLRVVSVSLDNGHDIAYPLDRLVAAGVINDTVGDQPLVVFHTDGTASALGASTIAEAEDVGATGVFDPTVDGEVLTFRRDGNRIVDAQTGSVWNIVGRAIDGDLAGAQLEPIVHGDHFWFSWAAFRPDTAIYGGPATE